jgi:hypothetical protein
MRSADIRERSFVIGCTSVCVLAAGVAWLVNPAELTLSLALVALVPPLTVAFVRAARLGIVDPLAVFSLCFAAYNGVLLVRLNYGVDPQQTPFATDGTTFFRSGILSGLGSLGLVVGWLLSKSGNPEQVKEGTPSQCTAAFLTGTVAYFCGIALYMAQYWQVGGYMQSVAMDRGQRFEMLTQTVSMPYEGFIVSGLSLMVYASIGQAKSRRILSFTASLVWLGLVLLQGDRRLALQTIMALGVVIGTLRPKFTRLRPLAVIFIAMAYFGAVIYGQYRTLIYDLASGRSTFKQAQVAAQGEDSIISKPEQSELGGPYMSVLYYSSGNEPLWWGLSYGMSIPAVLPRALYPGVKAPAISANLDEALHEGVGPVYGWGFNPVAEGFVNFGLPGAFGAMVLWSMFFAWLGANRYRSLAGLVACATLLQEAVNANRIDFRYVYFESFYCVSVGLLAIVVMKAAMELAVKSRNPMRIIISGSQLIPLRKSNLL